MTTTYPVGALVALGCVVALGVLRAGEARPGRVRRAGRLLVACTAVGGLVAAGVPLLLGMTITTLDLRSDWLLLAYYLGSVLGLGGLTGLALGALVGVVPALDALATGER